MPCVWIKVRGDRSQEQVLPGAQLHVLGDVLPSYTNDACVHRPLHTPRRMTAQTRSKLISHLTTCIPYNNKETEASDVPTVTELGGS